MLRFALDENFDRQVIRGLLLRKPDLDSIGVQDVGLHGAPDEVVLEWAAQEGRILLTHDIQTIPPLANNRVAHRLPMPGVFVVRWDSPIGQIIDNLLLIIEASEPEEWQDQVWYLPL